MFRAYTVILQRHNKAFTQLKHNTTFIENCKALICFNFLIFCELIITISPYKIRPLIELNTY